MGVTKREGNNGFLTYAQADDNWASIYRMTRTITGEVTVTPQQNATEQTLRYDTLTDNGQVDDELYRLTGIAHLTIHNCGQTGPHIGSALLQSQHLQVLNSTDGDKDPTLSWREYGWIHGGLNALYTDNGAGRNLYTNGKGNYWLYDQAISGPAVSPLDAADTANSPREQLMGATISFRSRAPFKTGGSLSAYGQGYDADGRPYWGSFGLHLVTMPTSGCNYSSTDATNELETYPLVSLLSLQGFSGAIGTGRPTTGSSGNADVGAIAALQIGTGGIFGSGFWATNPAVGQCRARFTYGAFIADYVTYGIYLDDAHTGGNAIYVHRDAGCVGIHTPPDSAIPLVIDANASTHIAMRLTDTDAGATAGPTFQFYRNSASPAANDVLGLLQWLGKDDAGNETSYGSQRFIIAAATNGSESSSWTLSGLLNGTSTTFLSDNGADFTVGTSGTSQNRALIVNGLASSTTVTAKLLSSSGSLAFVGTTTNHEMQVRSNNTAMIKVTGTGIGFFGGSAVTKPTVGAALSTGGAETNTNLATRINDLRTALVNLGLAA